MHCGVALEHPANAAVIECLSRPTIISDRAGLIRSLERLQEKKFSAVMANALHRLRNNIPDPPKPPSESPESVNPMALGTHPDIVDDEDALKADLQPASNWQTSAVGLLFSRVGFGSCRRSQNSQTREWP